MQQIHPHALFRLSVPGPLASRQHLEKGALKALVRDLAAKSYAIPDSRRNFLAEKTIEGWYYAWKRGGIDALAPKPRSDRGTSKISEALQEASAPPRRRTWGAPCAPSGNWSASPDFPAPGNSPAPASIGCCRARDSRSCPAPCSRRSTGPSSPHTPATSGTET